LYGVLNNHLRDKKTDYIVGSEITVADIALYPWIRAHNWAGIEINPFPELKQWLERMRARPGVQRGMAIPPALSANKEDAEKATKAAGEVLTIGNPSKL